MVVLYALTMFIGATLLFIVQPMVARLLLPSLGGSAAVWTTCMLFFQAILLAGYGWAHLSARYLVPRRLVTVHVGLMVVAAFTLPFGIPELGISPSEHPTSWLLAALALTIGLPFFVVSATAPLLQHFFAQTDHPDAADPYFLYGASNLGSMVALIGYPVVVEPWFGVGAQSDGWAVVYVAFLCLMLTCARTVFGIREHAPVVAAAGPLTWRQRARWVVLAAVPSSLMLGVTQHITTDLAPVPLLWVIPLALYLGTFVLVFSRRPVLLPDSARLILPIAALLLFAGGHELGGATAVALHLLAFFAFALFFHGTLARERPPAARLTEYFLLLSVGGALGGVFNALLAPLIFDQPIEYQVVMFLSVAFIAVPDQGDSSAARRWLVAGVASAAACYHLWSFTIIMSTEWLLLAGCFVAVLLIARYRPRAQNVLIAVVLVAGSLAQLSDAGLFYDRSFFASYKIYEHERDSGTFRYLQHGTTVHGVQALDPVAAKIPRSYHHPDGPVGEVLGVIEHESVLVVGLGVGAMAAYAEEGTSFRFYEIDPLVVELATDWFTYLSTCGARCNVLIGDGRKLLEASRETFDVIVLDAYNSSGVPTHLLTREALQLYLDHLAPDGVLLFNVSNRYIGVSAVVSALCADAGLPALERTHDPSWKRSHDELVDSSQFIVAATDPGVLAPFARQPDVWKKPPVSAVVWTDDFTNLLGVIRW